MKILIDAQLPPSLARLLTAIGHQAQHVRETGMRDATDSAIWDHALREAAVIFTKDEDFAFRRMHASVGPPVVWIRVGNTSTAALHNRLMPLLPKIEQAVALGDSVIEIR